MSSSTFTGYDFPLIIRSTEASPKTRNRGLSEAVIFLFALFSFWRSIAVAAPFSADFEATGWMP